MRKARIILVLIFVSLIVATLAWLGRMPSRSDAVASAPEDTRPLLRIGLIPERDIYQQRKVYTELKEYLSAKLDCRVELVTNSTYRGVLEDFRNEQVDAAFLGSLVAVLAADRYGAEVVAKPEYIGGISTYHGTIFVKADSTVQSLKDLRGKTIGGVHTTTAGALYPVYKLINEDLYGTKDAPQIVWSGTHDDVIREVFAGQLAAGAVKNLRLDAYLQRHPEAKVRILANSANVPENALVVRKGISPEVWNKLRSTLLAMRDDPEGAAVLKTLGMTQFVPCNLRDYSAVYDMAEAVGNNWSAMGVEGPAPHQPASSTQPPATGAN